jgi:hypothetical protein
MSRTIRRFLLGEAGCVAAVLVHVRVLVGGYQHLAAGTKWPEAAP